MEQGLRCPRLPIEVDVAVAQPLGQDAHKVTQLEGQAWSKVHELLGWAPLIDIKYQAQFVALRRWAQGLGRGSPTRLL